MSLRRGVVFLLLVIGLASSATAQDKPVRRIISLGPVITEELYLLSSESKLVGNTVYCQHPAAAKSIEKVGNVQEINLEKIVALRPDVVLATVLTDERSKERLRRMGINVVDVPNARNFDEVCESFLKLAQIVGRLDKAQEIVTQARKEVKALREKLEGIVPLRVFVQVGVNPLVTIGVESFANDFIQFAGGVNIVTEKGYLQYSLERVLASDPDVLLISSMGFGGEQARKEWLKFPVLKAVREQRVFIIDEYAMCSPTPLGFVATLRTIIHLLYPEAGI